jgi:surface protein
VQATHLKEITLSNLDTKSVAYFIRDSEPLIPDTNLSGEMPQKDFFITPLTGIQVTKYSLQYLSDFFMPLF